MTDEDIENGEIIFEVWNANMLKNQLIGTTKHKVSIIDKSGKEEMLQLNLHEEGKATGQGEVHCCISFTSPVNQPTPPASEPNKSNVPTDASKLREQDTGKSNALSSMPISHTIDSRSPGVSEINKGMPPIQEEAKSEKTEEDGAITSVAKSTSTPNRPALPFKERNAKEPLGAVDKNGNETSTENQAPPEGSIKASNRAAPQAVGVKGTAEQLDTDSKIMPPSSTKVPDQKSGGQLTQRKPNDRISASKEAHLDGDNKETLSIPPLPMNENHTEGITISKPEKGKGETGKGASSAFQSGSIPLQIDSSFPIPQKRTLLIKITSIEARDMPETESGLTSLWDKQDPYVKITVGQQSCETQAVRKFMPLIRIISEF